MGISSYILILNKAALIPFCTNQLHPLNCRMHCFRYLLLALPLALAACGDDDPAISTPPVDTATTAPGPVPAVINYHIVKEYPHDGTAFTEGLEFVNGHLYESTGEYGSSDIRKVDVETGKVLQQQKLDPKYFGEGLTVMNGKIYQLTYKERVGIVYDAATMKQERTFPLTTGEGWGLTHNDQHLIHSDGTDKLYFLDPATFTEAKRIAVTDQYGPVLYINELEFINGYIYANQWQTDFILKIDPATGKVVARADLGTLRQRANIPLPTGSEQDPEVMNGIAYDAKNNRIFVTGKNWPKLIEIKLDN